MNDSSSLKYFLTDHLGSVTAVLDASGNVLAQQRYSPFGSVRTDVGSITQTDFSYTGQRSLDAQANSFSLGLMDYHARFYDEAREHYNQALRIARGISDRSALIEALLGHGRWLAKHMKDAEAAFSDLNEALGYCVESGYRIHEADVRIALG